MKIELQSLTLTNFKGIKQLQVKFDHETSISGANATGKTTIFDACLWLLFGKDSTDRKDFGIKTLDPDGKEIPMIEHEVIGKIAIWDGDDNDVPRIMILKRTFREKWVKPRGQAQSEFTGNETIYCVDAVPCTQKEYQEKIDSLCKENLFKLLTNPAYFPGLNWTIQRQALFSLIPEVTKEEIIESIPLKSKKQGKFDELVKIINSEKTLGDYRKQISAEKRKLNDELVLIPARIDEVQRGKPEPEEWETIETATSNANTFILRKEEEKTNKLASVETETLKRSGIQATINSGKQRMTDIKSSIEDKLRADRREAELKDQEIKNNILDYEGLIQKNINTLSDLQLDMEQLQAVRTKLINEWKSLNAEQYTHIMPGVCETCGQELPEDFKQKTDESNRKEWDARKRDRLEDNKKKGQNVAGQILQKQEQIDKVRLAKEKLESDLKTVRERFTEVDEVRTDTGVSAWAILFVELLSERLDQHEEYQKLKKDIATLESDLEKLGPITVIDTTSLDKEISFARGTLQENTAKLAKREQISKADQRKGELEASQTTLSQKIAELEQYEFTIEVFIRTKVDMLTERINAMFETVRFKMFNTLINGGIEECCEVSIDGVPYSDLNGAGKIQAGCQIIKTMSKKYGIIAPVWIDNRESVTELTEMECQIISLIVDPTCEELKIVSL